MPSTRSGRGGRRAQPERPQFDDVGHQALVDRVNQIFNEPDEDEGGPPGTPPVEEPRVRTPNSDIRRLGLETPANRLPRASRSKKVRRPVRVKAVIAHTRWCMHCLRTAAKNFAKMNPKPLHVVRASCVFSAAGSKRCDQCVKRNDICDPPVAGLEGDRKDLADVQQLIEHLLNWRVGATFQEGQSEEHPFVFSEADRRRLAIQSWHLAVGFDSAEKAHRSAKNLTGSKKTTAAARTAYENACTLRKQQLSTTFPHPGFGADVNVREHWARETTLRLDPADDGFTVWQGALQVA